MGRLACARSRQQGKRGLFQRQRIAHGDIGPALGVPAPPPHQRHRHGVLQFGTESLLAGQPHVRYEIAAQGVLYNLEPPGGFRPRVGVDVLLPDQHLVHRHGGERLRRRPGSVMGNHVIAVRSLQRSNELQHSGGAGIDPCESGLRTGGQGKAEKSGASRAKRPVQSG